MSGTVHVNAQGGEASELYKPSRSNRPAVFFTGVVVCSVLCGLKFYRVFKVFGGLGFGVLSFLYVYGLGFRAARVNFRWEVRVSALVYCLGA